MTANPLPPVLDWRVAVCLATYNGARYLAPQLDSLQSQTRLPDRIFIADDGSTDATAAIVADYAEREPGRIVVLSASARLGPAANFSRCLAAAAESSDCDIFFCCDQDDLWAPQKIAVCLHELARLAALHGEDTPLLVHHDLDLIDGEGLPLGKTFWRTAGIDPQRCGFSDLLVRNAVTGCAMAFNRALLMRALPIPSAALMHDGWLALTAAAVGGPICPIPQALVAYRQHGANAIGAPTAGIWARSLARLLKRKREMRWIAVAASQARAVADRFGPELDARKLKAVSAVARWDKVSRYRRLLDALAVGLVGHSWARTVFLYLRLMLVTP